MKNPRYTFTLPSRLYEQVRAEAISQSISTSEMLRSILRHRYGTVKTKDGNRETVGIYVTADEVSNQLHKNN